MANSHIGIVICGISGRMGKSLCALLDENKDFRVLAGTNSQNPKLETVLATLGLSPSDSSVVLDFSTAEATVANVQAAQKFGVPILVATTGLTSQAHDAIGHAAGHIPVVVAANTSIGANLLYWFSKTVSSVLPDADAHIHEIHHRHKKDSPSGTALFLKQAAPKAPITSARVGNVVGEHSVSFFLENEQLELTDRVFDRSVFAKGAIRAAKFLSEQKPGLYKMTDVLGLKVQY